jgi:hypothetical protein
LTEWARGTDLLISSHIHTCGYTYSLDGRVLASGAGDRASRGNGTLGGEIGGIGVVAGGLSSRAESAGGGAGRRTTSKDRANIEINK